MSAAAGRERALLHRMIAADLGRFAILGSVPVCYGIGVLTLAQLYAVAFAAGVLSVLFGVSDSTLFVSLVPPDRYVDGNSLIYASRALSFAGGPSAGGLLVQWLTAPFAIAADALSFLGSALFLGRIRPAEPPPAQGGKGCWVWCSAPVPTVGCWGPRSPSGCPRRSGSASRMPLAVSCPPPRCYSCRSRPAPGRSCSRCCSSPSSAPAPAL